VIVSWTCPEDARIVSAENEETAEEAVRLHFADFPHADLELVGFTDGGPVIAGRGGLE